MSNEQKVNEDELDQDTVILDERDVKIARLEEATKLQASAIDCLVSALEAIGQQRTQLIHLARLSSERARDYLTDPDAASHERSTDSAS